MHCVTPIQVGVYATPSSEGSPEAWLDPGLRRDDGRGVRASVWLLGPGSPLCFGRDDNRDVVLLSVMAAKAAINDNGGLTRPRDSA